MVPAAKNPLARPGRPARAEPEFGRRGKLRARRSRNKKARTRMSKTSSASPKPAIAAASDKIDAKLVREIATLLSGSDLTEIEVEKGDLRIRVARHAAAPAPVFAQPQYAPAPQYAPQVAPAAPLAAQIAAPAAPEAPAHESADILKSPMVGTAYLRPSPDAKPFIEVGAHVTAGQKVLLVEAMKTFNDIVAHKSGSITAILIEDSQPVEYGQPLLVIA